MYITVNDIIGKKNQSSLFNSGNEVAVVIMLSNNVQYWLKEHTKIRLKMGEDVVLPKAAYMDKELNAIIGTELKSGIESHDYVLRTNKLENVMKLTISLEELDNSDNLEDGRHSNALFTYHVCSPEYFTHFEPVTPQNKKLKNGMITSLTLRMTTKLVTL